MKTVSTSFLLASCICTFGACASNKPLDLGDDKTGTTAQGLAAYEGAWDGYVEAYKFASGSDRVRITLDAEGQGTIEVGDAPPIPPFMDPSVGYPPMAFDVHALDHDIYGNPSEGYGYPVADAAVHSGRLSFSFWATDLQKAWCEAQTSYAVGSSRAEDGSMTTVYSCSPGGMGAGVDNGVCSDATGATVDCGFIFACIFACSCDQSGCTSMRRDPNREIQVDGALDADGQTLVGTLVLPDARATIRLERP